MHMFDSMRMHSGRFIVKRRCSRVSRSGRFISNSLVSPRGFFVATYDVSRARRLASRKVGRSYFFLRRRESRRYPRAAFSADDSSYSSSARAVEPKFTENRTVARDSSLGQLGSTNFRAARSRRSTRVLLLSSPRKNIISCTRARCGKYKNGIYILSKRRR